MSTFPAGLMIRLECALKVNSDLLAQQNTLIKASMRQEWTLDQLQDRYGGRGRDQIKAWLMELGCWPADTGPGRTTVIPLESVLLLDAVRAKRVSLDEVRGVRAPTNTPLSIAG
jgi:hypothetical protein